MFWLGLYELFQFVVAVVFVRRRIAVVVVLH